MNSYFEVQGETPNYVKSTLIYNNEYCLTGTSWQSYILQILLRLPYPGGASWLHRINLRLFIYKGVNLI